MFLNEQEEIPWDALNYMVAEANYGGRVTDPKDRRLIKILLKNFYTNDILSPNYKVTNQITLALSLLHEKYFTLFHSFLQENYF